MDINMAPINIVGLIALEFRGKISRPRKLEKDGFVEDTKWFVGTNLVLYIEF